MKSSILSVLLGAVLLAFGASAAAAQDWKAVAVNNFGDIGYGWGGSEEAARAAAMDQCQRKMSRTCPDTINNVIAVHPTWHMRVIDCPDGYYVGGSRHGPSGAIDMAYSKTRYSYGRCRVVEILTAYGR